MATAEEDDKIKLTNLSTSCDYGYALVLGSAQLLGLIIERAQQRRDCLEEKLRKAEFDVREMKMVRKEDAKANDKVVGIFASREQGWIAERKRLRSQIHAMVTEIQLFKSRAEGVVDSLNKRVTEAECTIRLQEAALEELEDKLHSSEELREEAQAAFSDLVSSQRRLEAEIGRALRQAEEAKRELAQVLDKKEEAVAKAGKLLEEIAKLDKNSEYKDRILSAMMRKSKLDSAEKEMLVKKLKIAKAKKKQAEMEAEGWKNKWESRQKMVSRLSHSSEADRYDDGPEWRSKSDGYGYNNKTLLLEYLGTEWQKEPKGSDAIAAAVKRLDHYESENAGEEFVTADIEHLQNWVHLEIGKQTSILEQRHYAEVEAFIEQMRLKDEKSAADHRQIVCMEVESKRLQSHIEGLNGNISQLREDNLKLESLLLDREEEIKSLKETFVFAGRDRHISLSENRERKSGEEDREVKPDPSTNSYKEANRILEQSCPIMNSAAIQNLRERVVHEIVTISSIDSVAPVKPRDGNSIICINEIFSEEAESTESSSEEEEKSITLVTLYPRKETEEENEGSIDLSYTRNSSHKEAGGVTKLATDQKPFLMRDSSGKMDIHALGVSYKIKRLKQQVLMLEKLAGLHRNTNKSNDSDSSDVDENKQQSKGFVLVSSLLNKQVKRFQSLEEKTDDLCRRMNENSRGGNGRDSRNGKTKEHRKLLQGYLEETFQLQRYMVATGQKVMDIRNKISLSFGSSDGFEESAGFNIGQFADVIRTLFE